MENERKQSIQTRAEAETLSLDDTATAAAPESSGDSSRPAVPVASNGNNGNNGSANSADMTIIQATAVASEPPAANSSDSLDTPDVATSGSDAVGDASAVASASESPFAVAAHAEQHTPSADIAEAPLPAALDAQTNRDLPDPAQPASWHAPVRAQPAQPISPVPPGAAGAPVPPPGVGFMQPRSPAPMPAHVPWEASSYWGPTTITIQANTAAGASYLLWWVSGMLIYFNERHNRFVRFHAMQSILLTGAMTVFSVLAYILSALCDDLYQATGFTVYRTLGMGIAGLAVVLIVIPWFLAMIAAWSGNYIRLPIVGTYAERYSAPPLHPPSGF